MGRRMAGTESAFTIGMRAGEVIGGAIAKTAAVLEDRADQKAAEQATQEFNQSHEAIKAPWNEVQERARQTAKEYADKGLDIPPDEARALQQEIRTEKTDYLTNKVDLAMTAMGKDPSNKYIQEQFKGIVDGTFNQLAIQNQQAQQEHQRMVDEHNLSSDKIKDERYAAGIEHRDAREKVSDDRFDRQEDRRDKAAGAAKTRPIDVAAVFNTTEAFKADGIKMPRSYWEGLLKRDGVEVTDAAIDNAKNMWVYDNVLARLKANGASDEQLDTIPKPYAYAEPESINVQQVRELEEDIAYWTQQDPQKNAVKIREQGKVLEEARGRLAEEERVVNMDPREVRANTNFNVTMGNATLGWMTRLENWAHEQGISVDNRPDPGFRPKKGSAAPAGSAPAAVESAAEGDPFGAGGKFAPDEEDAPAASDEMPTWRGKPVRRQGWKLVTDDGEVPSDVEAQMLQDYHDRGQEAPWMR